MALTPGYVGDCTPCGKRTYKDRKRARNAAKTRHPGEHLGAYACPEGDGWHLGHLPKDVVKGRITRGEIYDDPTATTRRNR
jgi:hypothetical protein